MEATIKSMPSPGASGHGRAHMRAALGLASRGLGRVAPNPAVGCIVVRYDLGPAPGGRVVGSGWTQPGGRPHAETEAIRRAGPLALGAHAYVTLEPCNHQGQTWPCTEALIEAGITAVTIAIKDPDPRVAGSGIKRLQDAGLQVECGLLADDARMLNAGFLSVVERNRPWVTMKTATTLDGAIASRSGKSQWITGAAARARGHLLRAQNDAVISGIGTVHADDPELTCRLAGLEDRSPIRVIVDPRGETPPTSRLLQTLKQAPLWLLCNNEAAPEHLDRLKSGGCEIITLPAAGGGRLTPLAMLHALAERGITRVLLEAGSALSASFISDQLVDEIAWFRAASIMGGDGLPAIAPMAVDSPANTAKFRLIDSLALDGDVLERYLRIENAK